MRSDFNADLDELLRAAWQAYHVLACDSGPAPTEARRRLIAAMGRFPLPDNINLPAPPLRPMES